MKLLWCAVLILPLVLLSNVSNGLIDDDENDDTDGVTEYVADENIVREKVIFVKSNFRNIPSPSCMSCKEL